MQLRFADLVGKGRENSVVSSLPVIQRPQAAVRHIATVALPGRCCGDSHALRAPQIDAGKCELAAEGKALSLASFDLGIFGRPCRSSMEVAC